MTPLVSIIMGSTSDYSVMEEAANHLNDMKVPFEINALSAHRTPEMVEVFAKSAKDRGVKIIIAAAGMAAHLPGVIAAMTPIPVIGVPIKSTFDGMDSVFSILMMPPGIPVATVGVNAAKNAAILATQILSIYDEDIMARNIKFKDELKGKIIKANKELEKHEFEYRVK